MKSFVFVFFSLFTLTDTFAQYNDFKNLGDKAFDNKDYFGAAYNYRKIAGGVSDLKKSFPFYPGGPTRKKVNTNRSYIFYRLAESYRLYQNYTAAEEWYLKIINEKYEPEYPLTRLWYGVCLRANNHFDESIKQLQRFKITYIGNDEFTAISNRELSSSFLARQQYKLVSSIVVNRMNEKGLSAGGNYALIKTGLKYWFTSSVYSEANRKYLNNIYSLNTSESGAPVVINLKEANSRDNIEYGTPSITASGNRMYLTSWYKEGSKTSLGVYISELENGAWAPLRKLNTNVNAEGYNALQPFITPEGKHLFFVSDKPGGQGGRDIWMSDLDEAGNPLNSVNLGDKINSPFDEEAPFYDPLYKRLVYSSKGFSGLGGFDFFESYGDKVKWTASRNLGYPINSSKDDLYYSNDPNDDRKAYISSDRESDCCLNLFEVNYKPIFIFGKITLCDSNTSLRGVKISLIDSVSKQILKQQETDIKGEYTFEETIKYPYQVKIEKTGYFTKTIPVPSRAVGDTLFSTDICLQKYKSNSPIELKNIFYDFNIAGLRPESKAGLDKLVIIMQENPGMKIELSSHADSIGSEPYNLNLSQLRAQSCVDYIVLKGIAKERIIAKGYGKSKPIALNTLLDGKDNPAGRQLNRRTSFTVIE